MEKSFLKIHLTKFLLFYHNQEIFSRIGTDECYEKNKKIKLKDGVNGIKISGTKWYVTIEYKGNIARFNGELCIDGFCARGDAVTWLKHNGYADDCERLELIRDVTEYTQNDRFKIYFIHEDGSNY